MLNDYTALGLLLLFSLLLAFFLLAMPRLFGPRDSRSSLLDVFECGVPLHEAGQRRMQVRFYLVAIVFIVFDIEAVFLFPWAVTLRWFAQQGLGEFVFTSMLIFLAVLTVGLAYLWRKGGLEWE